MGIRRSRRLPLFKELLALVLGSYLAAIVFVFGYLLWRSITMHLADTSLQIAILAALGLFATALGGYAASWFNYYQSGKLLGLGVGVSLYVVAAALLNYSPDNFSLVLPFFSSPVPTELQTVLPPLAAGALGGWSADRFSKRRGSASGLS